MRLLAAHASDRCESNKDIFRQRRRDIKQGIRGWSLSSYYLYAEHISSCGFIWYEYAIAILYGAFAPMESKRITQSVSE